MADSVAKSLNDLFSASLSSSGLANLESVIEDYFCFDSEPDKDESMVSGKYIHYYLWLNKQWITLTRPLLMILFYQKLTEDSLSDSEAPAIGKIEKQKL